MKITTVSSDFNFDSLTKNKILTMKKIKIFINIIIIVIFGTACNKDNQASDSFNDRILSIQDAIELVKQHTEFIPKKQGIQLRGDNFKTLSTFTLKDKNKLDAIHAINYVVNDDTLFSLVFADRNVVPIIAHGNGQFLEKNIVHGVTDWVNDQIKLLEHARDKNMSYKQYLKEIMQARIAPPDGDPCEGQNYSIVKGPLMGSTWGQGCFYNENLSLGCTQWCGRVPTGCVATAMGQVMKYHSFPNTYNWNLILDNYTGFETTQEIQAVASLMLDIGNAVNMSYTCGGSNANTCGQVPNAFTGTFGFTSANSCVNFTSTSFKSEIDLDRPVIFRGENSTSGHAWVGDGYEEYHICEVIDGQVYGWTYFYYHMNWGWNGSQNGWFNDSDFNGFNNGRKFIRNIKP